ncbi:EpsG family protein [Mucilaginibacter sp.]
MIYYLIFIALLLTSFFELYYKESRRVEITIFYYVAVVFLIFFAGFREVGFDYANYHDIFDTVNFSNYSENTIEVGFASLVEFIHFINLPFSFFLFLVALLSIGLKGAFIKKYSPYYFFSLLIYFTVNFLLSDMGQIRHGLAMSIVLLSFYDIFNKNKKGFFIKVFIAYLFHSSAIIVLPAYFIANIKKVTIWHIVIPLLFLIPFLFIDIKSELVQLAIYLPSQIQSKVAYYTTSEEFGEQLGFNMTMVLRIMIIGGMLYYYKEGEQKIKYYRQIFLLYIYGTILFMLFNSIAEMAIRFSNYFKILEFIILPMLVTLGKSLTEKHVIITFIVLYAAWSIYKMIFDPITSIQYLPYKNVLF